MALRRNDTTGRPSHRPLFAGRLRQVGTVPHRFPDESATVGPNRYLLFISKLKKYDSCQRCRIPEQPGTHCPVPCRSFLPACRAGTRRRALLALHLQHPGQSSSSRKERWRVRDRCRKERSPLDSALWDFTFPARPGRCPGGVQLIAAIGLHSPLVRCLIPVLYSNTWMLCLWPISLRIFGHTLTVTSPRWALRSNNIMVRDCPMPPPMESGISPFRIALW